MVGVKHIRFWRQYLVIGFLIKILNGSRRWVELLRPKSYSAAMLHHRLRAELRRIKQPREQLHLLAFLWYLLTARDTAVFNDERSSNCRGQYVVIFE